MTTITLNEDLDGQINALAQQTLVSVDEVVNDILAKYINHYCGGKIALSGRKKNQQIFEKLVGIGVGEVDGSVNYKKYVSDYLNEKFSHC